MRAKICGTGVAKIKKEGGELLSLAASRYTQEFIVIRCAKTITNSCRVGFDLLVVFDVLCGYTTTLRDANEIS
jgi:hypothetical protein